MPDMERLLREVEVDSSDNKEVVKAYHKGLDRGRIESVFIIIFVLIVIAILRVIC